MSRKSKFIISVVMLILCVIFMSIGVILITFIPNVTVELFTARDSLTMTGIVFSFIFAICFLGISVGFFIGGFERDY